MVSCARSQNSVLSVSVRSVDVVFLTAGDMGGGKPCRETSETAALREASANSRAIGRVRTLAIGRFSSGGGS